MRVAVRTFSQDVDKVRRGVLLVVTLFAFFDCVRREMSRLLLGRSDGNFILLYNTVY